MKIRITFDFDDDTRRWIAHRYGDTGKANHNRCKMWIETLVYSTLEDLAADYDTAHEEELS